MAGDKRQGLHPALLSKVDQVLAAMEAAGHPMKIVQGVRTEQEQRALYAQGRTSPGKKVTNCDGVRKKSNHQPGADGFGRAVDCAFIVAGRVVWNGPWASYGAAARAEGLVWGGDWVSLIDRPHIELPKS